MDEIRGDETTALLHESTPRHLWVFRGDSQPDRLRAALGMVIRKQQPTLDQPAIYRAIAQHLPFVVALKQIDGVPRLHLVAEWVHADDTLTLHPLLIWQAGGWQFTGYRPSRALD